MVPFVKQERAMIKTNSSEEKGDASTKLSELAEDQGGNYNQQNTGYSDYRTGKLV